MVNRKYRSKAEWRDLIKEQALSGLNGVAFCDQRGLSRKTFYRYRKVLNEKATASVSDQFIKVHPKPVQLMPVPPVSILHYRDSRLHLPVGCEPVWVAELMKALS